MIFTQKLFNQSNFTQIITILQLKFTQKYFDRIIKFQSNLLQSNINQSDSSHEFQSKIIGSIEFAIEFHPKNSDTSIRNHPKILRSYKQVPFKIISFKESHLKILPESIKISPKSIDHSIKFNSKILLSKYTLNS